MTETSGLPLLAHEDMDESDNCNNTTTTTQSSTDPRLHQHSHPQRCLSLCCQGLQYPFTLAQTFSFVALLASSCFLLARIIFGTLETTSSSGTALMVGTTITLHPAVVVLLVGVLWHVLLLWQGLSVALPSLSREVMMTTNDAPGGGTSLLWADSHAYTYQILQLVVPTGHENSRMSQFGRGAQTWIILITMILTSVCCNSRTSTAAAILAQLTGVLALTIALACTQRMASLKASVCRLDTLNTPIYLVLGVLSLQSSLAGNLLRFLRWSWQRWAEKPLLIATASTTTTNSRVHSCPSFTACLGAFLTATVLVVACTVMGLHVYERHGPVSLIVGCFLLWWYALVQGISSSFDNLSEREQQAALDEPVRSLLQDFDRQFLSTLLLVSLAYLWAPQTSDWSLSVAWLSVTATALITTVVGQIVEAWAIDFPVAFLTSTPPPVHCLVHLSAMFKPLTSVADVLQFVYHATYQDDILYIGSIEERLATAADKPLQEDVEAALWPANARIDSYPRTTNHPDVVLEEQEF